MRTAASKVMWVGRATVFLVGLAVILALVFGVASTAFAHKGDKGFFHLGHKNVSQAVSKLVGKVAGPALKVALRKSLLRTEADPLTRLELEAFGLKRFVAVGEEDYDAGRLPQPSPGR